MSRQVHKREAGLTLAPPPVSGALVGVVLLGLPAVLAAVWPGLASWLDYDRPRIVAGEPWRWVTCHWVHWSANQLFWDLSTFALLLFVGLRIGRLRTLLTVGVSALLISLANWIGLPAMIHYRGLSGIDSALFALVAVVLWIRARAEGDRWFCAAIGLALTAFFAKIGFEFFSGSTLFVDAASFVPVPLAHAVGGFVGLVIGGWPGRGRRAGADRFGVGYERSAETEQEHECHSNAGKRGCPPVGSSSPGGWAACSWASTAGRSRAGCRM